MGSLREPNPCARFPKFENAPKSATNEVKENHK